MTARVRVVLRWLVALTLLASAIGLPGVPAAAIAKGPIAASRFDSYQDSASSGCGRRAKPDDKIWAVTTYDHRVVTLRCGEDPSPLSGWGWRHIKGRRHLGDLGWDDDLFMWAMKQTLKGAAPTYQDRGTLLYSGPIYLINYDEKVGHWFRAEYNFDVAVIPSNGNVVTAYGNYKRTTDCYSLERCQQYP